MTVFPKWNFLFSFINLSFGNFSLWLWLQLICNHNQEYDRSDSVQLFSTEAFWHLCDCLACWLCSRRLSVCLYRFILLDRNLVLTWLLICLWCSAWCGADPKQKTKFFLLYAQSGCLFFLPYHWFWYVHVCSLYMQYLQIIHMCTIFWYYVSVYGQSGWINVFRSTLCNCTITVTLHLSEDVWW